MFYLKQNYHFFNPNNFSPKGLNSAFWYLKNSSAYFMAFIEFSEKSVGKSMDNIILVFSVDYKVKS